MLRKVTLYAAPLNGHLDLSKRKVLLLLFRCVDAEKSEGVCGANLTIFVKHKYTP